MIKRDNPLDIKEVDEKLKRSIDMVTRLYVSILKAEGGISEQEINILHSLLVNLFKYVDISWEVYVRDIIADSFELEEVVQYLAENLSQIDKIRVILSLIIMVKSDSDFRVSEITRILDLCKSFTLPTESFIALINHFDYKTREVVSIPYSQNISTVFGSVFTDYILFGREGVCDVRFRHPELAGIELFLMGIGSYLFVGSGSATRASLNGKTLGTSSIALFVPGLLLCVAGVEYDEELLWKIYQAKDGVDDIVFSKPDYNFVIRSENNHYEINLNSGIVHQNNRLLLSGKWHRIFHDDTLQIQGYSPFQLVDVIRERSSIGVENQLPSELFINFEGDFFTLDRKETNTSISMLESRDGLLKLYPPKRGWQIFVNDQPLNEIAPISINKDIIGINKYRYRINQYLEFVEVPFELETYTVLDIKHYFKDGQLALDSISFEARKGELIGIMGQSGSGKSTLLKILCAEMIPTFGEIKIDGKSLYEKTSYYSQFIGYIPQDDLLYPNLTVYENLWYRGRLRLQELSKERLDLKIINILRQVNLLHRKDMQVGDYKKKLLSGGERKRLNIALELLLEPALIICDEPTSGLSHNDALQIVNILKDLTEQGKIVMITIHQPSNSIFQRLDKTLLMDYGGKQAFYGITDECFNYFDTELAQLSIRQEEIQQKKVSQSADYMYEIISYPEYDSAGEPVYEQLNKVMQEKRKFSPDYWRDKYKRKMLYEIIRKEARSEPRIPQAQKRRKIKLGVKSRLHQLWAFIERSFKMKLRNRTNNIITFFEAPLLAFIISFILRYSAASEPYSYHQNINIGIYIFVSVIAFIFLGLSNSIEEVLDERKIILREKMMNMKMSFYQVSKLMSLAAFGLIQVLMYFGVSALVLGIRGLNLFSIVFLFAANVIGFSAGLMVSTFIKDNKAIVNLLPLILIPQIIFGGAVIEFERMNRALKLSDQNPIPEVVQLIPSRWLFEGMTTAYAKNTLYYRKLEETRKKALTLLTAFKQNEISRQEYITRKSEQLREKAEMLQRWTPERYNNEHIDLSVSMMDGRFLANRRNEFMASYKQFGNHRMRTWYYCLIIVLIYTLIFNVITLIKLKDLE